MTKWSEDGRAVPRLQAHSIAFAAREGRDNLKGAATQALTQMLAAQNNALLARLFSVKHEFPSERYRFLHLMDPTATLTMDLSQERFPFLYRGRAITIGAVELFVSIRDPNGAGTAAMKSS
jgi:hypothetical protein